MTAEHLLALADDLRWFARQMGRDLNAANLFVHTMLVRALQEEQHAPNHDDDRDWNLDWDEPQAA